MQSAISLARRGVFEHTMVPRLYVLTSVRMIGVLSINERYCAWRCTGLTVKMDGWTGC
jgi:hypothetical protein